MGSGPGSISELRGRRPSDIRGAHFFETFSLIWKGEDHWRFWGDRSAIDAGHSEKKATGAWKVVFSSPYVLALKPVANLKPDDWTGAVP